MSVVGAGVVWRGTAAAAGIYTSPRPSAAPLRRSA
ncbi:MAG: hypothetical protein K0S35_3283 [Geminicoccaceae bacterium]|nr:hypothetical protein [Geminicoccaceae bacterium]